MNDKQEVILSLNRYTELIKAEQKAKQYKQFLFNNSCRKNFMDIILAVEEMSLSEIYKEQIKREEN